MVDRQKEHSGRENQTGTFNDPDGAFFDSVYREYYPRLVNYADRIIHDGNAAESIVQGLFLTIWEQRKTLVVTTSLSGYLFRAVYNKAINSIEHRRIADLLVNDRLREFYFANVIPVPDAEQLMSDKEIRLAIDEAVTALPARCREIFILSKMHGYKNGEIARRLNISGKTVEAQMTIAFRRLRIQLDWLLVILFFAG